MNMEDEISDFVSYVSSLPSANVDTGAYGEENRTKREAMIRQREEKAARDAELNRQARIAEMNYNIQQHEKERAARNQKVKDDYIAGLSGPKDDSASTKAGRSKTSSTQKDRVGEDIDRQLRSIETIWATGVDGVKIRDGNGNEWRMTDQDRKNAEELKSMLGLPTASIRTPTSQNNNFNWDAFLQYAQQLFAV